MSLKLGEMLVSKNVISEAQLKTALETQKQIGGKLGVIVAKLRMVSEEQLAQFLGDQLKIPVFKLRDLVVHPSVSALVDVEILEKHQVLPLRRVDDALLVAAVDPLDLDGLDELRFLTGMKITLGVAARVDVVKATDYYFHGRPCRELEEEEKVRKAKGGLAGQDSGKRVSPQVVLQALTDLLIEKKVITQDELLAKVAAQEQR